MNSLIAFGFLCLLACVSAQYGSAQFAISAAWFQSPSCTSTPNAYQFTGTGFCIPQEDGGNVVGTNTVCNTGAPGYNTTVYGTANCMGSPIEMEFFPGGCIAQAGVGTEYTCGVLPIYPNWCHLAYYGAAGCAGPVIEGQGAAVGVCIPAPNSGAFISVWPNATTSTLTIKTCSNYLCTVGCNNTVYQMGCNEVVGAWCFGNNGQLLPGSTTGVVSTTGSQTTTGAVHTTTGAVHTTTGAAHTTTGAAHTTTGAAHTTTGAAHTTTGAHTSTTKAASNAVRVFAGLGVVALMLFAMLF